MTVYKRADQGDVWRYRKRVTLPNGTVTRVVGTPSINTKRAAEEAERAHVERVLNPPKIERAKMRMSAVFTRFLTDYVDTANNKESEKTSKRSAVSRFLEPELGALNAHEVTPQVISDLTAKLIRMPNNRKDDGGNLGTLSAKYVKNILQTLRKALRWAEELGWIEKAPKVRMPKVDQEEIRYLELVELDALLDVAAAEPMWFAAVMLGADAGLRLGELRALKWTDINEVTNRIVLTSSRWRKIEASTKSRKPRSVPISDRLRAALLANRTARLRGPYVLSRQDGKPYGAEHMNDTITRLVRNAKLTNCTWHTLRHTFCTRLAMRGVPVTTIQQLAGHADIKTTMRYMHVVAGAIDDAIGKLDREPGRAQGGRGLGADSAKGTEDSVILPFMLVTPLGLEK